MCDNRYGIITEIIIKVCCLDEKELESFNNCLHLNFILDY